MKDEKSPQHHKETHGKRNDIDESTPLDDVKAPNVFERAKEEIEALVQTIHAKKESHSNERRLDILPGLSIYEHLKEKRDLDQVFAQERTRKDQDKESKEKSDEKSSPSAHDGKKPNFIQKAKEEIEEFIHSKTSPRHHHHKETHGRSDDIDESTPIDEVKGPNVFERAKEEIEALVETLHSKKESSSNGDSPKKEGGLRHNIGRGLEKVCSPLRHKKD